MNFRMGGHVFRDVEIPVLWGERAVLQDRDGRLSVIDLSGEVAKAEIVGDEPAPDVEYIPIAGGFTILKAGKKLYSYNRREKTLTSISLDLPECQIAEAEIRIGTNRFISNVVVGSPVGFRVTTESVAMGASLPPGLAKLVF